MRLSDFLSHLDSYTGPDRKGDYVGICPGHSDGAPSLLVGQGDDGRLLIHCRAGCGKSEILDAMDLTMRDLFSPDDRPDRNVPISKASASTDPLGPGDIAALRMYIEETARRFREDSGQWADAARSYVFDRFGLTVDEAADMKLGFDPGGSWYDGPLDFGITYVQSPRLVIPFADFEGVFRGLQGRALNEGAKVRWSGPTNPEGRSWAKYAVLDRETGLDSIVVTEGPGDALTASSAGFDALAIRGAAVAKNEALLAELVEGLRGRRIVLAGDDDDAGRAYNSTLRQAFEDAGLAVFELPWRSAPQGASDVTEWRELDPAGFRDAFQDAVDRAEHPDPDTSTGAPQGDRFTELGMARRLRDRLSVDGEQGARFASGLGFYLWDGKHWRQDLSGHVLRREAQTMVEDTIREADDALAEMEGTPAQGGADWDAWVAQRKGAIGFESSLKLGGVLREFEAMSFVERDLMDRHAYLLNVENGTIDLRTGELRPHDRNDLITHFIPITYDPDAQAPRWESFLREIFPEDDSMPAFLRRLIGYGITGETTEQAFAVLWGTGANGKSVLTDTLTEVFRDITITTPFSTFEAKPSGGIPNDLAALHGARLVFASEGEQGKLMAESVIKRVTGSDLISARFMRQEFFEFRPSFLILLATNHKPRFRGQDEGLWRRVKMLPFSRYFKPDERDHHLTRTLRREAPGILAWAVKGAVEWYAADSLQEPTSIQRATETYRDAADGLLGFVDLYVRPEEDGRVRALDVFERYKAHVVAEGVREGDIWTNRTFYEAMEEKGYPRKKVRIAGRPEWALLGLRLLTDEEAASDLDDGPEAENDPHPVGRPREHK